MRRYLSRDRVAVAAGVVLPVAVCAILVPFRAHLSNTNVALVLVVAVVAVSVLGNRVAGAIAAILAGATFDFFFTEPFERFGIDKRADLTTTLLLLVVGLVVSQIAARARRLQVIAITDAGYLAQIAETARISQSATSPNTVVEHVRTQLESLLQLVGCRFEYGTLLGHPPRLQPDGSVSVGGQTWNVDRDGLPDQEVELRVNHNGRFYGRFMLRPAPGTAPPLQARLVALTLADQAGAAFSSGGRASRVGR